MLRRNVQDLVADGENSLWKTIWNSEKILWTTEFLNTEYSHASSSHVSSLEPTPTRSAGLGEHSVYTHFTKGPNCEICQTTKITKGPCRRRIGGAVPRAEIFGDLITADHKVLSDNCESRNNHRYAVVVQDPMDPVVSVQKQQLLRKHKGALQKFLEPERKPKVIYTDNSWNSASL